MNERSPSAGETVALQGLVRIKGCDPKPQPTALLQRSVRCEKRLAKMVIEQAIALAGCEDATADLIFHRQPGGSSPFRGTILYVTVIELGSYSTLRQPLFQHLH